MYVHNSMAVHTIVDKIINYGTGVTLQRRLAAGMDKTEIKPQKFTTKNYKITEIQYSTVDIIYRQSNFKCINKKLCKKLTCLSFTPKDE